MKRCDQCEMLVINGMACHEYGCLNANAVQCASCNETVQAHRVYTANDWDGIEYCKGRAEYQANFEAEQENTIE